MARSQQLGRMRIEGHRHRFGAERHGPLLLRAVALLMTVALANFLFAQLKAMGVMSELVTGEEVIGGGCVAALLCYLACAVLNSLAWLVTDIPDAAHSRVGDEERDS